MLKAVASFRSDRGYNDLRVDQLLPPPLPRLKPDLVAIKDNNWTVIELAISTEYSSSALESAARRKLAKYGHLPGEIVNKAGASKAQLLVLVVGATGIGCRNTQLTLSQSLGLTKGETARLLRDCVRLTIKGSNAVWCVYKQNSGI